MKTFNMIVSKKDEKTKKYVEVGTVPVTVPTLADIVGFITAAKETGEEEGVPVYDLPEANFVMGALLASVKANARNKLVSGTATVKDGLKVPETWAEFTAEGVRGGGEALAIIREAKSAFADWMSKQGKSEAVVNTLVTLFGNKAALTLQAQGNKDKVKAYVEAFAADLSEAELDRMQRPIQAVIDACAAAPEDAFADM